MDFVLSGEIPWIGPAIGHTLHLGGSREKMARAERDVAAGRHADWPMVLAASPHLADPGRIGAQGRRPLWTYTQVPPGSPVDQTEALTAVFERFAPGFRDIVVAARAQRQSCRRRYRCGRQRPVARPGRPTPRLNPWSTPIDGVYLCSSATPPGGDVHGMAGYYAARTVLRREFSIKTLPNLSP